MPNEKRSMKRSSKSGSRQKVGPTAQASSWKDAQGTRVVLLDLDGTLMDSSRARSAAWNRALKELDGIMQCDLPARLAAYHAIYNANKSIRKLLKQDGHRFEDMRQEWNSRMSYALLIAWSQLGNSFPRQPQHNEAIYALKLTDLLKNKGELDRVLQQAETIADPWSIKYAHSINRAMFQFWEDDWEKYRFEGVPKLLQKLRDAGIQYYVATEGHLPTQWEKICLIGLGRADVEDQERLGAGILPEQLLATSQAAQPQREVRAVERLIAWYHGREVASRADKNLDKANRDKLVAGGLIRFIKLLDRLSDKFNKDNRVQSEFFLWTLFAINQTPGGSRDTLLQTSVATSWNKEHRVRVAMVGDNPNSDVVSIARLAKDLKTDIMSVWIRGQSRYGVGPISAPGLRGRWVECQSVAEAGELFLLRSDEWKKRTKIITKPDHLFDSTLDPQDGETFEKNVWQILAAVGAVRTFPGDFEGEEKEIWQEIWQSARNFVEGLRKAVVADVCRSRGSRDPVIEVLLTLCRSPFLRDQSNVSRCVGVPQTVVELLLDVTADGHRRNEVFLALLSLLSDSEPWAAETVKVLVGDSKSVAAIRVSEHCGAICEALLKLLKAKREGFPEDEAQGLYARLLNYVVPPPRPPSARRRQTAQRHETIQLGSLSRKGDSQSIFLGPKAGAGALEQIRCLLHGPAARNIVCICGEPGSGKSSSLDALVRGALLGEGLPPSVPAKSSVIVFSHDPKPCPLVKVAIRHGCGAEVYALEAQVAEIAEEYADVAVRPIKFGIDELPKQLFFDGAGIDPQSPQGSQFDTILNGKHTIEEIRQAAITEGIDPRLRARILVFLDSLKSFVSAVPEDWLSSGLKTGKLTIVDCGFDSGTSRSQRFRAWQMILATLESKRLAHPTLLVFDELHDVFSDESRKSSKGVARALEYLERLGRHKQVCILGASQSPEDFVNGRVWADATVLLIHRLKTDIARVPKSRIWTLPKRVVGVFPKLPDGHAWYCSVEGQDLTGIVSVEKDID